MNDRAAEEISAWLDGRLEGPERSAFEARLRDSAELRAEVAAMRRVIEATRGLPHVDPPAGFAARVRSGLAAASREDDAPVARAWWQQPGVRWLAAAALVLVVARLGMDLPPPERLAPAASETRTEPTADMSGIAKDEAATDALLPLGEDADVSRDGGRDTVHGENGRGRELRFADVDTPEAAPVPTAAPPPQRPSRDAPGLAGRADAVTRAETSGQIWNRIAAEGAARPPLGLSVGEEPAVAGAAPADAPTRKTTGWASEDEESTVAPRAEALMEQGESLHLRRGLADTERDDRAQARARPAPSVVGGKAAAVAASEPMSRPVDAEAGALSGAAAPPAAAIDRLSAFEARAAGGDVPDLVALLVHVAGGPAEVNAVLDRFDAVRASAAPASPSTVEKRLDAMPFERVIAGADLAGLLAALEALGPIRVLDAGTGTPYATRTTAVAQVLVRVAPLAPAEPETSTLPVDAP